MLHHVHLGNKGGEPSFAAPCTSDCYAERPCENSQFVPFCCRSFSEYDVFVAQLNERGHKFNHFRRFAAAPIVFTQPRPLAAAATRVANGRFVPEGV